MGGVGPSNEGVAITCWAGGWSRLQIPETVRLELLFDGVTVLLMGPVHLFH